MLGINNTSLQNATDALWSLALHPSSIQVFVVCVAFVIVRLSKVVTISIVHPPKDGRARITRHAIFAIFVLFLYTYPYHTTWMDPLTYTMVAQVVLPLWWILQFRVIPNRFQAIPSQQQPRHTHPIIPATTLVFIALIATGSSSYMRLQSPAFVRYGDNANVSLSWGILSPPGYVVVDMVSKKHPSKTIRLWRQIFTTLDYGGALIYPGKTAVLSIQANPKLCFFKEKETCEIQDGLFNIRISLYYVYQGRNIERSEKQRFLKKKTDDILVLEYEGPNIPPPPGRMY